MSEHIVNSGDVIRSNKTSRLWIDEGEHFIVDDIVTSELSGMQGVLFTDRNGGKRVFWSSDDYTVLISFNDFGVAEIPADISVSIETFPV